MTYILETRAFYPSVLPLHDTEFIPTDFPQALDRAERRTNSLRHALRNKETAFSQKLNSAWEDERYAHHGHHHARHVKELIRLGLHSLSNDQPELFQDSDSFIDLSALSMQPYFHDLDQLMGTVRNMEPLREKPLKEKKGHGPAGALMMLALTPEYAEAAEVPFDEAWEIMSVAAVLSMRHDVPEQFDQTFHPRNQKAYTIDEKGERMLLTGEELLARFQDDELDLFSLSPSQIAEIVAREKEPYGFLDPEERSVLGLDPDFEQEHASMLEVLRAQDTPIMEHISDERKQRIKQLGEVNYWADMGDMISPYLDQFPRTFLTQYARMRAFSSFGDSQLESGEAFEMVLNGRGENAGSDDIRLCWEIVHAAEGISHKSGFSSLPAIKQFTQEHVLLSALELQRLGVSIMSGSMNEIDRIYAHRLRKLDRKRHEVEKQGIYLNGSYTSKKRMILQEQQDVKAALEGKSRGYSSENISQFQQLMEQVIDYLGDHFQMSIEELEFYKQLVEEGEDAPSQPFSNDSFSTSALKVV